MLIRARERIEYGPASKSGQLGQTFASVARGARIVVLRAEARLYNNDTFTRRKNVLSEGRLRDGLFVTRSSSQAITTRQSRGGLSVHYFSGRKRNAKSIASDKTARLR